MLKRPVHAGFARVVVFCFVVITAAIATTGCAHRATAKSPASISPTAPAKIGTTETGIASWYGEPYNGRRAASGEIFDMQQFVAAHRTLPFQTWVEVTDLDNGKKVCVRIIDRGPFAKGRIIDLSLAAAREIKMVGPGTARVKLKVIAPPKAKTSATPAARSPDLADGGPSPRENSDAQPPEISHRR